MTDASNTDERIKEMSGLRRALIRPELGGMVGTVAVFTFFILFAFDSGMFNAQGIMNWSIVSAQFMIIAVGACLLMIAGEFDLSVGSMIGFAGMMIAIFGVVLAWPMWLAITVTFAICVAFGWLNGYIVVRTGLPSFIVTLATLFILRGFTIFIPQTIESKTIIGGIREAAEGDWLAPLFGAKIGGPFFQWLGDLGIIGVFTRGNRAGESVVDGIPMLMIWAIALVIFGHVLLTRTRFGNWIFAAGGDALCRCACGPGENPYVHVHRLLRHGLCCLSGNGIWLCGCGSRSSKRIRGHHRSGYWWCIANRRLRLCDRRGSWRANLWCRTTGFVFCKRREFPFQGFPRGDPSACRYP